MTISVIIADDHEVVSEGLAALINIQLDMTVIARVNNGHEAVKAAKQQKPDVIIMDVSMPEMNGIDATLMLKSHLPDIKVIILSMHSSPEYIRRALAAGAMGYLLKRSAGKDLIRAIHAVCLGKHYFSEEVTNIVVHQSINKQPIDDISNTLSLRERQVLQLLTESKSTHQIAEQLSLSPKTIETYRSRLYEKLGLKDLPQLVRFAIKHGISSLE